MAEPFRIADEVLDPETHVVAITGEVDLYTAPEFKLRIAEPIEAGLRRVVVDLTEVSFIDSSSLGVLIGAHKRLRDRKGGLIVVCADRTILNTFRITGLDTVFEIVATRDDVPHAA